MALELDRDCPECGGDSFWKTASTLVTIGKKVKYDCNECDFGFVTIDGTVDTCE